MTTKSPITVKKKNAPRGEVRHLVTLPTREWPRGVSYVQSVQWYAEDGRDRWVVSQALKAEGSMEHTLLHRHDGRGWYLDTCFAMYAGHPSSFAVRYRNEDLRVLLRWDGPGGGYLHWMVYRPRKRWPHQARVHQLPPRFGFPATDETFKTLVTRSKSRDTEIYRVYDFTDLRTPVQTFEYRCPGTFQGHATDGKHVYSLYGWRSQWSWIEKRTLAGEFVSAVDVTHCRERKTTFEVEGLGWRKGELTMGMREGGVNRSRTVSVWAVSLENNG